MVVELIYVSPLKIGPLSATATYLEKMSSEDSTFTAYQKAHYQDDKRPGLIISNSILLAVAYIAVLLKFKARRLARTEFKADDYWNWTSLV